MDTRSNTTSALEKLDTITGGGRVSYVAASSAFDNSRTEDVSVAAELVEITTHTQKIAPSQSCYDNTGNIESTTTCDTKQKELTGNRHITSGTLFPIARDIDTSNNKGAEVIGDNVELF